MPHRPDVLFLDIEMPELDRFALLERLEPKQVPVPDTYHVRLHRLSASGRPLLLRERMHVLEACFHPADFVRTHPSAIVRVDRARAVRSVSRYEHLVVLASGAEAPLSREPHPQLEAQLQGRRPGPRSRSQHRAGG